MIARVLSRARHAGNLAVRSREGGNLVARCIREEHRISVRALLKTQSASEEPSHQRDTSQRIAGEARIPISKCERGPLDNSINVATENPERSAWRSGTETESVFGVVMP